jgi:hypothetical protein
METEEKSQQSVLRVLYKVWGKGDEDGDGSSSKRSGSGKGKAVGAGMRKPVQLKVDPDKLMVEANDLEEVRLSRKSWRQ